MRKTAWMLSAWLLLPLPLLLCSEEPVLSERASLARILKISRVYVDRFGGGENAAHIRDMIISSLHSAKLFAITENEERADAVLRGSAEDLIFTDTFSSNENLSARTSLNIGRNPDTSSSDRRSRNGSASIGESESVRTWCGPLHRRVLAGNFGGPAPMSRTKSPNSLFKTTSGPRNCEISKKNKEIRTRKKF